MWKGKVYQLYQKTFIVGQEDHGMILRAFIQKRKISKKALTDIKFHGGKILVNGVEHTVRTYLQTSDQVTVIFPKETRSEEMPPKEMDLQIIYEDDDLLILDKPSGLPTIPSILHPEDSLANGVLFYYDSLGLAYTFHAINRLDKDTSGLMLIAKHRYVHHLFSMLQRKHQIHRSYVAIVHGEINLQKGVVNAPIGRTNHSLIMREVRADGQNAVTHYEVLDRRNGYSIVKVQPQTGRTHQIRVHMAYIGHPLVGDDLYGGRREHMTRHALHSNCVAFFHPLLEREIVKTCDYPLDFKKFIAKHIQKREAD